MIRTTLGGREQTARVVVMPTALATLLAAPPDQPVAAAQTEEDEELPEPPEVEVEVEAVGVTRSEDFTEPALEVTNPTDRPLPALALGDPAYQFAAGVSNARFTDVSGVAL